VRGDVYALSFYNNELYAGGLIDTFSGFNNGRGIVKWNGTDWVAVGGNISGTSGFKVMCMVVYNGELWVGGSFNQAGSVTANNIAKWNGTQWTAIAGGGANDEVRCMYVWNGDLYVGGSFGSIGGITANGIARFNGSVWSQLGSGTNAPVNGISHYGSELFVTGEFTYAGGTAADKIARWNGTSWTNLSTGLNFAGHCLYNFGTWIYIGGLFTVAGSFPNNCIVKYGVSSGIHEHQNDLGIQLLNNPATSFIGLVSQNVNESVQIKILNSEGSVVALNSMRISKGVNRLDVSLLTPGVYLLYLYADNKSSVLRFVKH
jgi:hypothetical protein